MVFKKIRRFWQKVVKLAKRNVAPYNLNRELMERLKAQGSLRERVRYRRILKAALRTPQMRSVVKALEWHANEGSITRDAALQTAGKVISNLYAVKEEIDNIARGKPSAKNQGVASAFDKNSFQAIAERINANLARNPKNLEDLFGYNPFPVGGGIYHIDDKKKKSIHVLFSPDKTIVMVRDFDRKK